MKTIAITVLIGGALFSGGMPASAAAGLTCLQSELIDHTHVVNPSTVLFYMKDGKIWQNDLPQPCGGLAFNGFVVRGHQMEICGGQGITVIKTHQACVLGKKFTAYQAPPKP